jgi:AhpD family alkylhydroperoxidase
MAAPAHDTGETVTPTFKQAITNIPGKSLVAVVVDYAPGGTSSSHVHANVSQISNCAYCLDMHTRELLTSGQKIEKLTLVQAWAEARNLFDERERAALAWAETVTHVAETGVPDEAYQAARAVFEERELVDLTIPISVMNAYNRMAIRFRHTPQAAIEMAAW